jgi:hypothetical protein
MPYNGSRLCEAAAGAGLWASHQPPIFAAEIADFGLKYCHLKKKARNNVTGSNQYRTQHCL